MGKVFTLFFVPVSVVAVAGAIEHVASVPLNRRKEKLENYVLAQFGELAALATVAYPLPVLPRTSVAPALRVLPTALV